MKAVLFSMAFFTCKHLKHAQQQQILSKNVMLVTFSKAFKR
jgi:hypothetical protein